MRFEKNARLEELQQRRLKELQNNIVTTSESQHETSLLMYQSPYKSVVQGRGSMTIEQ